MEVDSDLESSFMQMKRCMIKTLMDIFKHQSWEKIKVQ